MKGFFFIVASLPPFSGWGRLLEFRRGYLGYTRIFFPSSSSSYIVGRNIYSFLLLNPFPLDIDCRGWVKGIGGGFIEWGWGVRWSERERKGFEIEWKFLLTLCAEEMKRGKAIKNEGGK